jgi:hypothetical protein
MLRRLLHRITRWSYERRAKRIAQQVWDANHKEE